MHRLPPIGLRILALVAGLFLVVSSPAQAKPPLGKNWPANRRVSIDRIDHAKLDKLLHKYVDADGFVDYSAWQTSAADRKQLQDYLAQLSKADRRKRASHDAKLAFWINAYNAVTIEGILQVYPTTSIRNHTARVFGYNIWKELPLRVGGDEYSLEQIEHDILRKMKEPRIHFAIVCASVGCPRLRYEAYAASKIEKQLADNATDFFSRQQNLQVKPSRKSLRVSMILDWFADDFGSTQKKRWTYLKPYLPASAQAFAADGKTRISFLEYDWELNDQSKKKRTASRR